MQARPVAFSLTGRTGELRRRLCVRSFLKTLPNLAKPCQTAGRPEQVSPCDEAARTAPWRRSPDLPYRYSYRHRASAAPALANLSNETNPISPNSREIMDCKAARNHSYTPVNLEKRSEPNSRLRFNRSPVQRRYPERTQFRPSYLGSMAWHRCLFATLGSRACRTLPLVRTAHGSRFTVHEQ